MKILTKKQVLAVHAAVCRASGGFADVRDVGLLESAIESPLQTFMGEELYPSLEQKGARLGYALICNHAFVDGNKRIGVLAMLLFFKLNGVTLLLTDDDIIKIGLGVASGKMGYQELVDFIRSRMA